MRTRITLLALLGGTALLAGCNDNGNTTTIINQGIDCGLIRDDLVGNWTIDMTSASRTLQNCTGDAPGLSGTILIDDFPRTYGGPDGVNVFGSDGSTSFQIIADRTDSGDDPTVDREVTGTIQADSCLALLRVWDPDEALYVQCIGTFTISNGTLSGGCDSVEIDSDGIGGLDTSCSLDSSLAIDASIN
ncbi:MAG TPA: hypothetical protein VGV60_16250 [Candidatus Polarisedimenticolia bacterium]|nr:hypothetical protein [Candidatus Polarisedimenticolia bacterium]